ncbi:MAG: hypothetical protein QM831_16640 [Kofleriaceae bacterium]
MRRVVLLVAIAGCRQILGLDAPHEAPPIDAEVDAETVFFDAPCPDVDGDGICDSVDDWQCGPMKPDPLPTMHTFAPAITVTAALTNIAVSDAVMTATGSTLVNVMKGDALRIDAHLVFHDTSCPGGCIDQIEVGFVPTNHRAGCIFDSTVDRTNGTTADINYTMITAPMTAGAYELRGHIGQGLKCADSTDWFNNEPPTASDTFAMICVY